MLRAGWLWLALGGCFGDRVVCEGPEQVVAEAGGDRLTCADAQRVADWLEVLAGRSVARQRAMLTAGLRDRFEADPRGTRALVDALWAQRQAIVSEEGFDAAARRSEAVYALAHGDGPITPADGALYKAVDRALSVWKTHDGDRLALTEADMEAWIYYASLCRQVQGAGVLRISVADRVSVYAEIGDRFEHGTHMERVALASLGGVWHDVRDKWDRATYEEQQAWVRAAPLPPPMTATSLGYFTAIVEGDVIGHAASLHGQLGPLSMAR